MGLAGHCCTGGNCRPFGSQGATNTNKQERVIVEHCATNNRKYHIPNNICTTPVRYLVNILVWKGHHCFCFGMQERSKSKNVSHNFTEALLELDVGLTWVMDVGLAVFAPQSKLVVDWNTSQGEVNGSVLDKNMRCFSIYRTTKMYVWKIIVLFYLTLTQLLVIQ